MFNQSDANPKITNCTFYANTAVLEGGGLSNHDSVQPSPKLFNCIMRENLPDQIHNVNVPPLTVRYSNVQGGWPGAGNIDSDPQFVDPGNGDYRLQPGSPCIDAGHNWAVPPDASDVDGDGDVQELTPLDLDGNPRFNADPTDFDSGCGVPVVVDMGAYEFQFDSANGVRLGDLDGDGDVDVTDFLDLLGNWGPCSEACCLPDLNLDGTVGVADFLLLLGNWS